MIESTRRAELEAQGWTACFVADEPRLSEAVELYESFIGSASRAPTPRARRMHNVPGGQSQPL
ncbi:MAG: hypothetical protein V1790_19330 [Planctomycetota bacterium]